MICTSLKVMHTLVQAVLYVGIYPKKMIWMFLKRWLQVAALFIKAKNKNLHLLKIYTNISIEMFKFIMYFKKKKVVANSMIPFLGLSATFGTVDSFMKYFYLASSNALSLVFLPACRPFLCLFISLSQNDGGRRNQHSMSWTFFLLYPHLFSRLRGASIILVV